MARMDLNMLLITSKMEEDQLWECTTLMNQSLPSPELASSSLLTEDTLLSSPPRTPSSRSMMADSKTFSNRSMKKITKNTTNQRELTTNTDLLMIWLLRFLREMEVLSGLARTTMVMFKVISLPRVMDHSDS